MKTILITCIATALCTASACGQIINPKETTKRKVEERTNRKADETIDKGLNKLEEGIGSLFKKKPKANANDSLNKAKQGTSSTGNTDFSLYKNFDFVPGKNVLFFDNFSDGSTSRWRSFDGEKISVINNEGSNWLENRGTRFFPINLGVLPEDVTIEMDAFVRAGNEPCGTLEINFVEQSQKDQLQDPWLDNSSNISISPITETPKSATISFERKKNNMPNGAPKSVGFKTWQPQLGNTHARISISRRADRVSVYINNEKLFDNVELLNPGMKYMLSIHLQNYFVDETRMYITNVRVANGVPNASNEVKAAGRFVTNAIYFDSNSDRIKPESWTTLKQAAEALKANPGKFLIVGHTDSDGADDANLKLSQNRAMSVKTALIKEFGIEESWLMTSGKGESQPVASNNTTLGKAQNRRVEFIKQQ